MKHHLTLGFCFLIACGPAGKEQVDEPVVEVETTSTPIVEATSLDGRPLRQRFVEPATRKLFEARIDSLMELTPYSEDQFILLGEYYASINQFNRAIDVYSEGLSENLGSYKLLRHRAHRYLSVRKIDEAMMDLEKALELITDSESQELEYYLNGKVKGTYLYWIWYHIGLAHYFKGNFEDAADAFQKCIETSVTGNNLSGATDWLYNSYQKAGKVDEAQALINDFSLAEDADPHYAYARRISLYRGEIDPDELFNAQISPKDWNGTHVTLAYGLGNHYIFHGEVQAGIEIHQNILKSSIWNAWAYVAAESGLIQSNSL